MASLTGQDDPKFVPLSKQGKMMSFPAEPAIPASVKLFHFRLR